MSKNDSPIVSAVKSGPKLLGRGLLAVGKTAVKHPKETAIVAGAAVAAVAATAAAGTVAANMKKEPPRLKAGKTQGGKARIITARDANCDEVKILEVDGVYQSATYTDEKKRNDLPFETYRAFALAFSKGVPSSRILMIGGGAFTFPKYVLSHHKKSIIDVLEPDDAMVAIAREYFYLSDAVKAFDPTGKRLHIIGKDGESFLKFHAGAIRQAESKEHEANFKQKLFADSEAEKLRYGVIINDAFSGKNACSELTMYGPLSDAKACLKKDGLYVLNVADPGEDDALLKRSMEELGRIFRYVHVIPCADKSFGGANAVLLIATDGEYSFPGETQVQKTNQDTLDAYNDFEDSNEDTPEEIETVTETIDVEESSIPGKLIISEKAKKQLEDFKNGQVAQTSKVIKFPFRK